MKPQTPQTPLIAVIYDSTMFVNNHGELMTYFINKENYRFELPINGLSDHNSDDINPFQFSPSGMVQFTLQRVQPMTPESEDSNDNQVTPEPKEENTNPDIELDMNELPAGCISTAVYACVLAFIIIMAICIKYNILLY